MIVSAPHMQRLTISFVGDAVIDQGITIPPGVLPFMLDHRVIGDAITEPISAVVAAGSETIGVVEFFR